MSAANLMSVNCLFQKEISVITAADIPECGRYYNEEARTKFFSLEEIIDSIGLLSTRAQGLKKPITTLEKLRLSPNHKLYILKDEMGNGGAGKAIGILKIGVKKLFLYDRQGKLHIDTPTCILDFYIIDSRQRLGMGKKIFDYMLEDQKLKAYELAIDGPSSKMLRFLKKHYEFTNVIKQSNNFTVCEKFFEAASTGISRPQEDVVPIFRPILRRWQSEASSVIQGGGSSCSSNLSNSESESSVSEADGETSEERWEVAVPPPGAELQSHDHSEADNNTCKPPERPSTLTFECSKVVDAEATVELSKEPPDHTDSQLTNQGYVDLKFHHKKLW